MPPSLARFLNYQSVFSPGVSHKNYIDLMSNIFWNAFTFLFEIDKEIRYEISNKFVAWISLCNGAYLIFYTLMFLIKKEERDYLQFKVPVAGIYILNQ